MLSEYGSTIYSYECEAALDLSSELPVKTWLETY